MSDPHSYTYNTTSSIQLKIPTEVDFHYFFKLGLAYTNNLNLESWDHPSLHYVFYYKNNWIKSDKIERAIHSIQASIIELQDKSSSTSTSSSSSSKNSNANTTDLVARKSKSCNDLKQAVDLIMEKLNYLPSQRFTKMCKNMIDSDFFYFLLINFDLIDFEVKKCICKMFTCIMGRREQFHHPFVKYILGRHPFIPTLIAGCRGSPTLKFADKAYHFGQFLRTCIVHREILRIFLRNEENLFLLMELMEDKAFDISTDAFLTVREALSRHRILASDFAVKNYKKLSSTLNKFLDSDNIALKSQGLALLNELIFNQGPPSFSNLYFSNPTNIQRVVRIFLTWKSRSCEIDIFCAFKMMVKSLDLNGTIQEVLQEERGQILQKLSLYLENKHGIDVLYEKAIQLFDLLLTPKEKENFHIQDQYDLDEGLQAEFSINISISNSTESEESGIGLSDHSESK